VTISRIPSVEGGIQPTLLTTKGDLISATAASTVARLAVGANDLLLTAASGETTGLKYTGAWTTYTPTLVTGMTLGNGTRVGRYCQIGKVCFVFFSFTLGSTSAITGNPEFSLPVTSAQSATYANGDSLLLDYVTAEYYGKVYLNTTTSAVVFAQSASGSYVKDAGVSSTVPMTWATNDKITANFWFEVA